MEKEDFRQLELFSQSKSYNQINSKGSNRPLGFIRAYEKIMLVTASLIITGILSFSLGVERGKKIKAFELSSNSFGGLAVETQSLSNQQATVNDSQVISRSLAEIESTPPEEKKQEQPTAEQQISNYAQGFTVQIASFHTKKYAEKEVERLKKRGFSAYIMSKNNFSVVCVGSFTEQELAKNLLAKLRKLYHDSYIRRL